MPLGSNRDYKTADRRARTQLAKHKEIMDKLISQGMTREQASATALIRMRTKKEKNAK